MARFTFRCLCLIPPLVALHCAADGPTDPLAEATNPPQGGAAGVAGAPSAGAAGEPSEPPPARSCLESAPGADRSCGVPSEDDCCTTLPVSGGTCWVDYDGDTYKQKQDRVTVSSFWLDKYEVTVGRFRAFVRQLSSWRPKNGDGAHHKIEGSGWNEIWPLPASEQDFRLAMAKHVETYANSDLTCSWTDEPGENEHLPMDCVTWYEMFAFCAWDGGRLPTSAERYYAGAGGSEQRIYPWSVPPSSQEITTQHGNFNVWGDNKPPTTKGLVAVGLFPQGFGRWGHADLVGNATEFTLDWLEPSHPAIYPCTNCANVGGDDTQRILRDGGWYDKPLAAGFYFMEAPLRGDSIGGRCARDL